MSAISETEKQKEQIAAFIHFEKEAAPLGYYSTYRPFKQFGKGNTFFKHIDLDSTFRIDVLHNYRSTWSHSKVSYHGDIRKCGVKNEFDGLTPTMMSWFEEGLVPFCTRCPVCQDTTKFNFLDTGYIGDDGPIRYPSRYFTEIYCPKNHYFYDSHEKKHYIAGGDVYPIVKRQEKTLYACWNPKHCYVPGLEDKRVPIGWKVWDPKSSTV